MSEDRRRHRRIPLTLSIAQPISIEIHSEHHDDAIPGIMVNVSAGGMGMIVFRELPENSKIEFNLKFMGLSEQLSGTVVRQEEKLGNTFLIGIQFAQPVEHLQNIVGHMAEDFDICEIRYLMKGENACYPQCSFRPLCAKRIRKDF
jgi:hypothetical protein